jgi:hypothetical protein
MYCHCIESTPITFTRRAALKNLETILMKAAIVIIWNGPWPGYLRFFLKSLERNKEIIDVLIFTENSSEEWFPRNFKVINMNLTGIHELIESKTGLKTASLINNTRKLCDLKPCYGHVFEDYLKGYNFWGIGDLDLIYGRLDKYLTKEVMEKHDLITVKEEYVSGAFTVMRNNETMKRLYLQSPDVNKVFAEEKHFHFDEAGIKYDFLRDRNDIDDYDFSKDIVCFTTVAKRAAKGGIIKAHERSCIKESIIDAEHLIYDSDKGILSSDWTRYAIYHFVTEKAKYTMPPWKNIPDRFILTSYGVFKEEVFFKYNFIISRYKKISSVIEKQKKRLTDSFNYRIGKNLWR